MPVYEWLESAKVSGELKKKKKNGDNCAVNLMLVSQSNKYHVAYRTLKTSDV